MLQAALRAAASVAAFAALLLPAAPAHGAAGFGDVEHGRFYTDAVQWMVDERLSTGTAAGCFSPDDTASRAEVAVFLHRVAGEPDGGAEPFTDVNAGDFFAEAVAWMYSSEITIGTGPGTFSPHRSVTRAEVATFLHRLDGEPDGGAEPFVDVAADDYFAEPVAWMASSGITTGTSPVLFSPNRDVTRGELAAFLYRYHGEPPVDVEDGGVCTTDLHAPLLLAEAESFDLLNALRASVGRHALVRNAEMDAFARDWSRQMHDGDFFEHSSGPYGENIAWWSASGATPEQAAQRLHDLWVDSPGHYANMTNRSYTSVGVGFWQGPGGWYATHVFSFG